MIGSTLSHFTNSRFEVNKISTDVTSQFNPNLYVEYGNMIHFAENAWTSEGRLNVGRIHHQIGQNGLSVFSDIFKVQALTAK